MTTYACGPLSFPCSSDVRSLHVAQDCVVCRPKTRRPAASAADGP